MTKRGLNANLRATVAIVGLAAAPGLASPQDAAQTPQQQGSSPAQTQKLSEGQAAFNNHCRTCHTVREGDNRLGPSLYDIVGKKAGTNEKYAAYSQAMRTSRVVWNEQTLDRFLANPEAVVPNNNMKPFKAVPDEDVRDAIVDYLKSEAATG